MRWHALSDEVAVCMIWEGAEAVAPEFLGLGDGEAQHLQFGCCLVRVRDVHVLLDTACGTLPHPLLDTLRDDVGVDPTDVQVVVHSHLHADHIGNNVRLADDGTTVPAFPNAVHYVRRDEWEYATRRFATGGVCPWRANAEAKLAPIVAAGRLRLVTADGVCDARLPELTMLHTPGHTPGHAVVRIAAEGAVAYYAGDALHVPAQVERPELSSRHDCCTWTGRKAWGGWPMRLHAARALGREWSPSTAEGSRRRLLDLTCREGALLLSPHFPEPGVGRVVASEGGNGHVFRFIDDAR